MRHWVESDRQELRSIYKEWSRNNMMNHIVQGCYTGLFMTICMLPMDYAYFGIDASHYRESRLTLAVGVLGSLFLATKGRFNLDKKFDYAILTFLFWAVITQWNFFYASTYVWGPPAHRPVVSASLYMMIFGTSFLTHRFWRVQYGISLSFLGFFLWVAATHAELRLDCLSFLIWTMVTFVFNWMLRREFCSSLFSRYGLLRAQMPSKVAHFIASASPTDRLDDEFRPRIRPCACVSIDWRGFQAFAASNPPEVVAWQICTVHDTVLAILKQMIPSLSFYADWTADEIFIVIYSDQDANPELLKTTWAFCQQLQGSIRPRLAAQVVTTLPILDIGVAVGQGLLGLVGPTNMKKTTIIGALPGIAKRLETAAKMVRQTEETSDAPIVCMNAMLHDYIEQTDPKFAGKLQPLRYQVKDLEGQTNYVYLEPRAVPAAIAARAQPLRYA